MIEGVTNALSDVPCNRSASFFGKSDKLLVGGFWLMYLRGYNMSIASAVGFIALGGVASEIAAVMLVYVNQAIAPRATERRTNNKRELSEGIVEGAALRIRPIAM